ncbi:hypothetical protein 172859UKE1_156 [Escherichia phage vB_EcoM-172859UKE1]|nr:hypothetical protein 172859UKE1_156 [Escherichia phage vB_EcoM-172859UKE1]
MLTRFMVILSLNIQNLCSLRGLAQAMSISPAFSFKENL